DLAGSHRLLEGKAQAQAEAGCGHEGKSRTQGVKASSLVSLRALTRLKGGIRETRRALLRPIALRAQSPTQGSGARLPNFRRGDRGRRTGDRSPRDPAALLVRRGCLRRLQS